VPSTTGVATLTPPSPQGAIRENCHHLAASEGLILAAQTPNPPTSSLDGTL